MTNSKKFVSFFHQVGRLSWAPLFLLLSFLLLLTACGRGQKQPEFRGTTMGSSYSIKVVCPHSLDEQQLAGELKKELDRIDHLMSNWNASSDVTRFNIAGANQEVEVDIDTARVVERAKQIHKMTHGVFDPTLSPLIELWGFGTKEQIQVPSEANLKEALSWVSLDKVTIKERKLIKSMAEITLNLSAITPGYASDKIATLLEEKGIQDYMVDITGEIRCRGKNLEGNDWRIGIDDPGAPASHQVLYVLVPKDMAVATSGDYRNFWESDGKHYSHIIDPRSGYPVERRVASATVLAPDGATADALSTSFMILDPQESIQLADSLPGVSVFMLLHDKKGGFIELKSKGMEKYLLPNDP